MSKQVQIIISAKDLATRVFSQFSNTAQNQLNRVSNAFNQITSSVRALTVPATATTTALVYSTKRLVDMSFQATTGLKLFNQYATKTGSNLNVVNANAERLANQLKVPADLIRQNASELLKTGYSWQKIEGIYRGAAASALHVSKSAEDGIRKVTDALVTGLSVHLNQIGIVENLGPATDKYAKSIGKTADELTEAERSEAGYQMILQATSEEIKNLPTLLDGVRGSQGRFNTQLYETKKVLGKQLMPVWDQFYSKGAELLENFNNLNSEQMNFLGNIAKITGVALGGATALGLLASAGTLVSKIFGILGGLTTIAPFALTLGAIAGGALLLKKAWDNNWSGIQTTVTQVYATLEPKIEWLRGAISEGWDWAINATGTAWKWFRETSWEEKWLNIKTWTSKGWDWVINTTGDAWKWFQEEFPWASEQVETAWNLTLSFGDWALDTVKKIFSEDNIETAWNLSLSFATDVSSSILEGLKTGNWGSALDIGSDVWKTGTTIYFAAQLAKNAGQLLLGQISRIFAGISSGVSAVGGGNLAIATLSVGIALAQAYNKGAWDDFAANMVVSLTAALVAAGLTKSPTVGALAFTVGLNFKLGSKIGDFSTRNLEDLNLQPGEKPWLKNSGQKSRDMWNGLLEFLGSNGLGFYEGGILPGIAGPDKYPALLAPGEAVVPAKAVRGGWPSTLEWFKSMGVPGFYNGLAPSGNPVLDSQITNTASWLSGIEGTINSTLEQLSSAVVGFFSFLSKAIISVLDKFFPGIADDVKGFFNDINGLWESLFKKSSATTEEGTDRSYRRMAFSGSEVKPTSWDKLGQLVTDLRNRLTDGVGQMIYSNAPILQNAIQGAQAGSGGGPAGMAAGAILSLIGQSETFATLMANINPLLQSVADTVGLLLQPLLPIVNILGVVLSPVLSILGTILQAILVPVMYTVFEGLKIVGLVTTLVAAGFHALLSVVFKFGEGIMNVLNWVFSVLPGFKDLETVTANIAGKLGKMADDQNKKAEEYWNSIGDLAGLTWEEAMARAKNVEQIEKQNQQMYMAPEGFKIALETFRAANGIGVPAPTYNNTQNTRNSTTTQRIEITNHFKIGDGNDPELESKVLRVVERANQQQELALRGIALGGA